MNNDGGKSVFARYIEEPEKERPEEPSIVQKGPHPIIPPTDRGSSPSEKLLDWIINRWPEPTLSVRNILQFGPGCLRDRKSAIDQAEILARYGWLTPIAVRQHNMKKWRIVRGPGR
jgi:hypothetical protein